MPTRASADNSLTVPDLLIPRKDQDLSAYRYDGEVFGWNRTFTEVAALASTVRRGSRGNQRGEVFLLVYAVADTSPKANVNCHTITHADNPDDPVPLDDVRDMMGHLENPEWLNMWPVRPHHTRPRDGMQVRAIWDPMDPNSTAHTPHAAMPREVAPDANDDALCAPGVAFVLTHHGQRRVQPHAVLDMRARCRLLRLTDNRLYWGRADVAADMVRFDFSPRQDNEESARFVVSAAWRLAEPVHFVVQAPTPLPAAWRQAVWRATQEFGDVRFAARAAGRPGASARGPAPRAVVAPSSPGTNHAWSLQAVTASARFMALGRRVAHALGAPPTVVAHDEAARATLNLTFGAAPAGSLNALGAPGTTGAAGANDGAGRTHDDGPSMPVGGSGPSHVVPASPYLEGWRVSP